MERSVVSERVKRISISSTMQIAAEAKKMKSEGIDVIDLSVGESDFPTPENIKAASKRAIDNNLTTYTLNAGTLELRQAIAEKLKRENNLTYSPDEIIVSNGAKHSLFNAIQSTVNFNDEVIIPAPYWVSYPEIVRIAQGKPVFINCNEENSFKLTPEALEKAVTPNTKVLILCNPSNPTGSTYTEDELRVLAGVIEKGSYYVIADEIYEKLVYDNFKFASFASMSESLKKRTILINGVSKAYAMTGWRIGYAAGPEDVIKGMNKIQSHSTSSASSISQYAAMEAIGGAQTAIEMMTIEYQKRRDYLYEELNSINGIKCRKPEGAFYLFPNFSKYFHKSTSVLRIENSFDLTMYLLYEAKVAVVPGSAFGAEGFIRISYSTSMDKLIEAARRIKEALFKLH